MQAPLKGSRMKAIQVFVAASEAATGVMLLVSPSGVVRLLFGAEVDGVGVVVSRIAGIALIALGVGCWPGGVSVVGLLVYSAFATLYLACLLAAGAWVGVLLWPAVAVHAVLTILLVWAWSRERRCPGLGSETVSRASKRKTK